ncbi:hypothetical protein BC941DRAFT_454591 [Chlamydoabsidia padenii]|nr:hypothetical protein BC941DRAFT_454591 [Chlamydoabsidia padenii]
MPSRTTMFPYTTTATTTTTPSSTTNDQSDPSLGVTNPGNQSDFFLGGSSTNLNIPTSNDIRRRRSGSVTLLSSSDTHQDYGNAFFTSGFPPMMEENASDTVQSTLASLGLDDSTTTSTTAPPTASYLPTQQRHRAYTVSTRAPPTGDRLGDMLPMGFSPFSPQTRSSVMQRPRAVSLGMADEPHLDDDEISSFTPFGMSSLQSTGQYNHQQQMSPSRLDQHMLADRSLRMSRSSGNLMDLSSRFDITGIYDDNSMDDVTQQDDLNAMPSISSSSSALLDSPSSAPAQVPSRALWLGNINPSLSVNDLLQQFSLYGNVESARILSDKECAFVNFSTTEAAVAAKNDLELRLGSKLGGTLVRIGFGKADVALAMALTNEAGPNAQGPTRALWVGNIPANMNIAILQAIFQAFGPIESVRVLSHKNCGFINFEHQEDAVRARKNLQNKEILGPGSGTVRIGFAKAPSADDINNGEPGFVSLPSQQQQQSPLQNQMMPPYYQMYQPPQQQQRPQQSQPSFGAPVPQHNSSVPMDPNNSNYSLSTDTYQATQWATAMMMTTMMMNASGKQSTTQPSLYSAIAAERQFIIQQLCQSTDTISQQQINNERTPISYFSAIPSVPELSSDRSLEPLRLRDMRKRLESGQSLQEVELIAHECMNEIVELCSDYIGNTVVQKLFEQCTESTKQAMLERIAPYLAAIGVHKNGTWAAQKIIDYANTPTQIEFIRQHIAPYVPLLLLDQFGNYVVQCCLRMGAEHNQYIFDAIVDKCWEIGQGRFGARAVRSILENNVVTLEQRVYCAAAIVQNAVLLTTNANGTLLLVWLLDTSELSGRYRVLYPRLLPYLSKLCTHKLGSMTVFKIIQQHEEPDTSQLFLNALVTDPHLLDDILRDQIHGVVLMQKILALQPKVAQYLKSSLDRLGVQQIQGYKKLIEELESIPPTMSQQPDDDDDDDTAPLDMASWMKNPQAVAMMANMYAAAMTAAATSQQQQQQQMSSMMKAPELPQFNRILKSLLSSSSSSTTTETKKSNV